MADKLQEIAETLGKLHSPLRNRYFYGKMLTERHFELEQDYFNRKRWMLNRLGLGQGVLCGLEVAVAGDGRGLQISAGVAIDGYGREIIVPAGVAIPDPRKLPCESGNNKDAQVFHLCLAYHECDAEPVPVLVNDCDTHQGCAPSIIRERYRVWLCALNGEAPQAGLSDEQCAAIFPTNPPDDFNRREAACQAGISACPAPETVCVVLGTIAFDEKDGLLLDDCAGRQVVYSNTRLMDLLACLAERVETCCRQTLILRYVSGDAQSAAAGALVKDPLVVQVVDEDGQAMPDVVVTFKVRGGGGLTGTGSSLAASYQVSSAADGLAQARWQLGPNPGLNTLEAAIDAGGSVVFMGWGQGEPDVSKPPVVNAIWPPNETHLLRRTNDPQIKAWFEHWIKPHIEVTFDRPMTEAQLANPNPWLRVYQFFLRDQRVFARQILLRYDGQLSTPVLSSPGTAYGFSLEIGSIDATLNSRFLVLMRAQGSNIEDTNNPAILLDAEFEGGKFTAGMLKRVWDGLNEQAEQNLELGFWDAFQSSGNTLPSGNGQPGGQFHSWFMIENNSPIR